MQYYFIPFFETIIRYLGGLLSAHALTQNRIYLKKAEELVQTLDPIFNSPSGMPWYGINPRKCVLITSSLAIINVGHF